MLLRAPVSLPGKKRRPPCPRHSPVNPHHLVDAAHRRVCCLRPPACLGGTGIQGLLAAPRHAGGAALCGIETEPKSDERDLAFRLATLKVRRSHGLARPMLCFVSRRFLSPPHSRFSASASRPPVHLRLTCPSADALLVIVSRRLLHAAPLEGHVNECANGFGAAGPRRGAALYIAQAPRMAMEHSQSSFRPQCCTVTVLGR